MSCARAIDDTAVDDIYLVRCFQIPSFTSSIFVVVVVVVAVVVLTLTRIIKSVVTGQAPSVNKVE